MNKEENARKKTWYFNLKTPYCGLLNFLRIKAFTIIAAFKTFVIIIFPTHGLLKTCNVCFQALVLAIFEPFSVDFISWELIHLFLHLILNKLGLIFVANRYWFAITDSAQQISTTKLPVFFQKLQKKKKTNKQSLVILGLRNNSTKICKHPAWHFIKKDPCAGVFLRFSRNV